MNRRSILLLSLGLNALLLVACWQLWSLPKPLPSSPSTLPARLARLPAPPSAVELKSPTPTNHAAPSTVHWSQLASTDFFTYRDNLLAIGCPEATVRDILESEIDEWLIERWQPILDSIQTHFWDRAAERGEAAFKEEEEQLLELLMERTELFHAVLGAPKPDPSTQDRRRTAFARRHQGLPEELYSQLLSLEEQSWQAEDEFVQGIQSRADPHATPEELAVRKQRRAEHEANRRALLGDWADELELRHSRYAQWHAGLPGFEPTEAEWRAVAKAGLELDAVRVYGERSFESRLMERYGIAPERSAEELEAIADAQARYETTLRSTLGPMRYAEYQRASDRDYHLTRLVTQRLGLDDDIATQAWDIQRAAQYAADQLRAAEGMDDARRQAALQDINTETVRVLHSALGDRGYDAYQEHAGAWLHALSQEP
jgi:hypothetical protein